MTARLPEGRLVASGSLPRGLAPETFKALLLELVQSGYKPTVDSSGAALRAGVALVQPNRRELAELLPVQGDGIAEAKLLFGSYGVPVLPSLSAAGAAYIAGETLRVPAPAVEAVNPVTAGDCLLAAFNWARSEGWSLTDALRPGVAASAENAARGAARGSPAQVCWRGLDANRTRRLSVLQSFAQNPLALVRTLILG